MASDLRSRTEQDDGRGRQATRPGEVPARGWLDVLKRTVRGIRDSHASIVAAGVAFYAFLALVPALIAVVAIYGLVANPADVKSQITSFTDAVPRDAQRLLSNQLSSITRRAGGGTGIAAILAIAGALWSASSGIAALKKDNHAESLVLHPFLKLAQFGLKLAQFLQVGFPLPFFLSVGV